MSYAYLTISSFYYNKTARRTGIPYLKRIDDGLNILRYLGASDDVLNAWCIHPLVQTMTEHQIADVLTSLSMPPLTEICTDAELALAKQYADVANSFLPKHVDSDMSSTFNVYIFCPKLKMLLIADKVQNYVDFYMSYEEGKFERSSVQYVGNRMDYFNMWLSRLDVDETNFETLREFVSRNYPWINNTP